MACLKFSLIIPFPLLIAFSLKSEPEVYCEHFPNGAVREINQKDSRGRRHGECLGFYANGTLEFAACYDHGAWVKYRHYWPNGQLSTEARESSEYGVDRAGWMEDGSPSVTIQ